MSECDSSRGVKREQVVALIRPLINTGIRLWSLLGGLLMALCCSAEGRGEGRGLQAEQLLTLSLCLSSGDVFTDHWSSAHWLPGRPDNRWVAATEGSTVTQRQARRLIVASFSPSSMFFHWVLDRATKSLMKSVLSKANYVLIPCIYLPKCMYFVLLSPIYVMLLLYPENHLSFLVYKTYRFHDK